MYMLLFSRLGQNIKTKQCNVVLNTEFKIMIQKFSIPLTKGVYIYILTSLLLNKNQHNIKKYHMFDC